MFQHGRCLLALCLLLLFFFSHYLLYLLIHIVEKKHGIRESLKVACCPILISIVLLNNPKATVDIFKLFVKKVVLKINPRQDKANKCCIIPGLNKEK